VQKSSDPLWQKSSYSGPSACVEFARLPDGAIGVRDSKNPDAGHLTYTREEIAAAFAGIKAGEFDHLLT
jgi:hypothetical protein